MIDKLEFKKHLKIIKRLYLDGFSNKEIREVLERRGIEVDKKNISRYTKAWRAGFKSPYERRQAALKAEGFSSYQKYFDHLAKKRGFKSCGDYKDYLAQKSGFKDTKDYIKNLLKEKGLTPAEYRRNLIKDKYGRHANYARFLAKNKGFDTRKEYNDHQAQLRGFKGHKALQDHLAQKKGYVDNADYVRSILEKKGFKSFNDYKMKWKKTREFGAHHLELSFFLQESLLALNKDLVWLAEKTKLSYESLRLYSKGESFPTKFRKKCLNSIRLVIYCEAMKLGKYLYLVERVKEKIDTLSPSTLIQQLELLYHYLETDQIGLAADLEKKLTYATGNTLKI